MQVLRPAEGIYAFYDGRVPGQRFAEEPNWVDEGALSLGIASYAIVVDDEALVYDTHISVGHAKEVRRTLEEAGVSKFTVLLSHCHLDHVAGTEAFTDGEILAGSRTDERLRRDREAIEDGSLEGPPAINPLILPTRVLEGATLLTIGDTELQLISVNIHSDDATVVWLPEQQILLAGDTMEDTVTYVDEPEGFAAHLEGLEHLDRLGPMHILPNHGDPGVIGAGGYSRGLNRATQQYIRALMRMRDEPELRSTELKELIAGPLGMGWVNYFEPYEAVHQANLRTVLGAPEAP